MDAGQLLEYADENWIIDDVGAGKYLVTVTWADGSETVGLLSFAVKGQVLIGCPIMDDAIDQSEALATLIENGEFGLVPSPEGKGNYLCKVADVDSLSFVNFDNMLDAVFDAATSAQD